MAEPLRSMLDATRQGGNSQVRVQATMTTVPLERLSVFEPCSRREDLVSRRKVSKLPALKKRRRQSSAQEKPFCSGRCSLWSVVCSASYPYSSGPLPRSDYSYRQAEPVYTQQSVSEDGLSPNGIFQSIKKFSAFCVTAITRTVLRFCPEGTATQTVELGVKGGLALVLLLFARAILSLLIACGSILGLILLGTRILQQKPKQPGPAPPPAYPPQPVQSRYPPGVVVPTGVYYQSYFATTEATVLDPYTADVLNVYRDPPMQSAYFSPRLHWPEQHRGYLPKQPPPPSSP